MPRKKVTRRLHRLDKILCLEGEWTVDLRREESVEPLLQLLKTRGEIDYIHRRCGTRAEFEYYLGQMASYHDYRIVYFAFHGAAGHLQLAPGELITLDNVAQAAGETLRDKLVYFGSCRTMKRPAAALRAFLRTTGAAAVAGYTKEVGWVESSAFELMFLYWAAYYKKPAFLLQKLRTRYRRLAALIGFQYFCRGGAR